MFPDVQCLSYYDVPYLIDHLAIVSSQAMPKNMRKYKRQNLKIRLGNLFRGIVWRRKKQSIYNSPTVQRIAKYGP